jgi:predicted phosphodiesterase
VGDAADICAALTTPGSGASLPAVLPSDRPVRVLAFGDFGDGGRDQSAVARAMERYARQHRFDFGLTLGDNFYPQGLASPMAGRWDRDWEAMYDPLGIRIYATLGNHDYQRRASPDAEIARSRLSSSWCLPRRYYTFMAGPVQFFALDTNPIARNRTPVREQLAWLRSALRASRATWKVVYGHHPVYTGGEHGEALGYLAGMRERLLPILKEERVDVYLTGHDHDLEALKPEGGVVFFVSGGGGKDKRPLKTDRCRAWGRSVYGFTVLEARKDEMTVRYVGTDGEVLYETSWKKGSPPADCSRP